MPDSIIFKKLQRKKIFKDVNETFKKINNSSAFCSDEDKIVPDNFKIDKTQRFSIIPPIGGG